MDNDKFIDFLRKLKIIVILKGDLVGDLEMTAGNYDDSGNLIKAKIPTITTNFCEIGLHDNNLYFVFIIHSNTNNNFNNFFDAVKDFSNVKIYGFKNFNKTLYPIFDFDYKNFEKEIQKDKYLQIQFNYDVVSPEQAYKEYRKIKNIFIKSGLKVVDQLNKIAF